jgi:septum formation protein
MKLILASQSPRRVQLLKDAGFAFDVAPADIDETPKPGERPEDYVLRLAREKALASVQPGTCSMGADTSVILDGVILGKPVDTNDAKRMLKSLCGRDHEVLTAYAVIQHPDRILAIDVVSSKVTMKPFTDAEIDAYIATGEPMDKAGSYAAQGKGGAIVEKIEGSFTNVVGLPMEALIPVLKSLTLNP